MTRGLKQKSKLLLLLVLILLVVIMIGFLRISSLSSEAVSNMSYSEYQQFTDGMEGVIGSVKDSTGEILWSPTFVGYNDTYNLVGELRDSCFVENVVTNKSKNILLNTENYKFAKGVDSLSNSAKTIELTLNHDLNEKIYHFMVDKGVTNGSVLFMNASTGEIVTAVSVPGGIPDGKNELPSGSLINKNLSTCIPGSTMKIVTTLLLSQLDENFLKEEVDCSGKFESKDGVITCSTNRGITDLEMGIGKSCNVFFATEIVRHLDTQKDSSMQMLRNLHISGEASDQTLDILTRKGSYTGYSGDSTFVSTWSLIGEGEVQMSPIDMVSIVAGIVHHGNYPEPYLIKKVSDSYGNIIEEHEVVINNMDFDNVDQVYEVWKSGFEKYYETEEYGPLVTVAKTGTAEYTSGKSKKVSKMLMGYIKDSDLVFFIEVRDYSDSRLYPYEIIKMLEESNSL